VVLQGRLMNFLKSAGIFVAVIAAFCVPMSATVSIQYLKPSAASPQPIGTVVNWTVAATDSVSGPLTFQFKVGAPGSKALAMVKDFNVGTLQSGTWKNQPFAWSPAACQNVTQSSGVVAYTCEPVEGVYEVKVVAKDFVTGESASKTVKFQVTALVTGSTPAVVATANPLVALFSAPSCASGSQMRVSFQQASGATPAMTTNYVKCHPPATMTFEVAGMYPSTTYNMFSQTKTGSNIVNGSTVSFMTGALPSKIPFPAFKVLIPPGSQADTTDSMIFHGSDIIGGGPQDPYLATDLSGNVMWYYYPPNHGASTYPTRPLQNGTFLGIEDGQAWNKLTQHTQILRQFDLAGNVLRETNTGIIQQELLAMGAKDGGPCSAISKPAPVGSACLGGFDHEIIQTLNNGYTAAIADVEMIFPPGTQGDTSGLPVDIVGCMIVVLDTNWQTVWYFDAFEHAGGAPQLDINRPAVLGEHCVVNQKGCSQLFLQGPGISPMANDWLHANSIYYWPAPQNGTSKGDLVWSSRHQDWAMRVNYQDGTGNGNILWRMGNEGDFTFNNINNDPWPWFSHQHEVGIEDNGSGVMTILDNGNTRVSPPPLGLGRTGCKPNDCDSRGMALSFNESTMQVTPVMSMDLGVFSSAMGSAQLLSNENYFFVAAIVVLGPNTIVSYDIQVLPTSGTVTGTQVYSLETPEVYRAWQVPDLYNPPIT